MKSGTPEANWVQEFKVTSHLWRVAVHREDRKAETFAMRKLNDLLDAYNTFRAEQPS